MVSWNPKLYASEEVKKHLRTYKRRILKNNYKKLPLKQFRIIAISSNPNNCFDIYSNTELWLDYHKKEMNLEIVGIAESEEICNELLQEIVMDILREYDSFDKNCVRDYFEV